MDDPPAYIMRWFTRLAICAGILAVVVAAGLAALVLLADLGQYKAPLAQMIKHRFDRSLRMDGDVRLDIFPRPGIEARNISLSEPRSEQVFAVMDKVHASVALWPLLSGRVVIDHVRVDGLKANVVRYRNGHFNFEDLIREPASAPVPASPSASTSAPAAGGPPLVFDVAEIDIQDTELAWRDYVDGTALRVEKLSGSAGRIAPRRPFSLEFSARLLGQTPRVDATVQSRGQLIVDPAARRYAVRGLDLKAVGVLPSVRATALNMRGDLSYDAARESVEAGRATLMFQGDIAGERPLRAVDLSLDLPRLVLGLTGDRLEVDKLALRAKGRLAGDPFELSLAAPALRFDTKQVSGQPVSGLWRLGGEQGGEVRAGLSGFAGNTGKIEAGFSLSSAFRQGGRAVVLTAASPLEASLNHSTLALPQIVGKAEVASVDIPFKASVQANFKREHALARIEGTVTGGPLNISLEMAQFDDPHLHFSVTADTLDLDKFTPAARSHGGAGTGASAGRAAQGEALGWTSLAGWTATGNVKFGRLVARGIRARDVSAAVRIADGRGELSSVKAALYGGTLSGSVSAEAESKRVSMNATLANVDIEGLLREAAQQEVLRGRGTVSVDLEGTGATQHEIERTLAGSVGIALRNGAVRGLDLGLSLRRFRSLLPLGHDDDQGRQSGQQTNFNDLRAQIAFVDGIGTVRSLAMNAPPLLVRQGDPARIDLPARSLDLIALVSVGGVAGDLAGLRQLTVPVRVSGPFVAPTYSIQWSKVASGVPAELPRGAAERLRDAVRDGLKGLFNR